MNDRIHDIDTAWDLALTEHRLRSLVPRHDGALLVAELLIAELRDWRTWATGLLNTLGWQPAGGQWSDGLAREVIDSQLHQSLFALNNAGTTLGQVCAASTLSPGESLVEPIDHAAVRSIVNVIDERNNLHIALKQALERIAELERDV